MSVRGWKLVAANESAVVAKPFLDPIVVEDGESNRRLADPPCANKSGGFEVLSESDDPFNQLVSSETVPRRRRRRFTKRDAIKT
jgi:hypothetical protein